MGEEAGQLELSEDVPNGRAGHAEAIALNEGKAAHGRARW